MENRIRDLKEALNKPKDVEELMDEQLSKALHEHKRSRKELFMSAITAGLEIGFSVFLMATIHTKLYGVINDSFLDLLIAISYPLGFIFVILGRSELFTEHTTVATMPVLTGHATFKNLFVLWAIIYFGNLIGGYVFGSIMAVVPVKIGAVNIDSLVALAHHLIDHPWYIIGGSGILAGWLMGLLSWLVVSSQETISRIVLISLVTSVIGIGGLHHSIVGSIEIFTAMLVSAEISITNYLIVQLWATIGNIIGGTIFVAYMKFSHIRKGHKKE
jgi:formate/nitrite transporter FocA (FNT family)